MKLEWIQIARAPGLKSELRLDELKPGLNLVLGPNASGKSTFCRAVRASLWPGETANHGLEVRSSWQSADGLRFAARLDAGHVTWTRDGSPATRPKLPGREAARAYELSVRELLGLGVAGEVAHSIAEQIARELSGGFDLPALARNFPSRTRPDQTKRSVYEKAKNELSRLEAVQDALAEREQRLAELESEIDAAKRAEESQAPLQLARSASEQASRLARLSTEFEETSPVLAKLDGSELRLFDEEERRQKEARQRLAELERKQVEFEAVANANRLSRGALAPEMIDRWADQIATAANLELELRALREDVASAEAGEEAARRQMFAGTGVDREPLGPTALEELEETLRKLNSLESKRAGIAHQLDRLAPLEPIETSPTEAALREAARHLRRWLAAGEAPGPITAPTALLPLSIGLGGGGLLGVGLGLSLDRPGLAAVGAALLALGLGLQWGALWQRRVVTTAPTADRGSLEREFSATGLAPPTAWNGEAVQARLREIESKTEDLALRDRSNRQTEHERRRLEAERAMQDREIESLRAARLRWAEHAGIEPGLLDLELLAVARNLDRFAEARQRLTEVRARQTKIESELLAQQMAIASFLAEHGALAETSATAQKAQLQMLRRRSESLREAERGIDQLRSHRSQAEAEAQAAERRKVEILALTDRPDPTRADLEALIRALPGYRERKSELEVLRREVERLQSALAAHPELLSLDPAELELRWSASLARLTEREALLSERAEIQAKLEQAGQGQVMEEAIARWKSAEAQMEEDLALVLEGMAARLLLEQVERLYQSHHEPDVLARARAWFERFTHHAFALEISRDGGARLVARDTVLDEARSLEQLSDGTRAQLLLAARMAFIGGLESGETLPFFLDEALSTTDHLRFDAVAQSLLEMAEQGRQLFYLSSNPADIEAWQVVCASRGVAAHLIELGAQTRAGRRETRALEPAAKPVAPAVGGMSAAEYAQALDVPEIEPEAPVSSWHLYYVAHLDLELLRAAIEHGVWTVGQWQRFRRGPLLDSGPFDPAAVQRVDAHIEIAESTHRVTRIGRGRRVPIEALEASGAISETFLEAAKEEHRKEDGHPARLVAAVGALPRFQKAKRDQLREYLAAEGYLDERPSFEIEAIVTHVTEELRDLIERRVLPSDALPSLVRWYAEKSGWTSTLPVSYSA